MRGCSANISEECFINCMDGFGSPLQHKILIMTTNHYEKLSDRFIREERIDLNMKIVPVDNTNRNMLRQCIDLYFPNADQYTNVEEWMDTLIEKNYSSYASLKHEINLFKRSCNKRPSASIECRRYRINSTSRTSSNSFSEIPSPVSSYCSLSNLNDPVSDDDPLQYETTLDVSCSSSYKNDSTAHCVRVRVELTFKDSEVGECLLRTSITIL